MFEVSFFCFLRALGHTLDFLRIFWINPRIQQAKNLHLSSFNWLNSQVIHDKSLDTRPHFPYCVSIAEGVMQGHGQIELWKLKREGEELAHVSY